MTRDQIETLAMSTGIGLLMFLALAAVVRWLRFVIVGSLPVLAIVLVAAVPVSAQPSLLAEVTAERARYGAVTPADVAAILNAVAWRHRSEGWGLLEKTFGANCPTGRTSIACDILVHRPSGQHFDVLRDAEGSASPVWQNKGPIDVSRFLAPVDPGGSSGGPVTPPEPQAPPVDLGPLLTRLDALEQAVQALSSTVPPLAQQVGAHGAELERLALAGERLDALTARVDMLAALLAQLGCRASVNLGFGRVPVGCAVTGASENK